MIRGVHGNRSGIALIVILGVLALLCLIGVTLVTTTRIENKAAVSYAETAQARMICESALQIVLRDIFNDSTTRFDKYGDERWYHYAQDEQGNLCFGGTVGGVMGSSLTDESGKFTPPDEGGEAKLQYLAGLIIQPNVNRDDTRVVYTCNSKSLNVSTNFITGRDLTGIATAGDEYRLLGGYKLAVRNHTQVFPIGEVSDQDGDDDDWGDHYSYDGGAGSGPPLYDAKKGSEYGAQFHYGEGLVKTGGLGWDEWCDGAEWGVYRTQGTYGVLLSTEMVVFDADEYGGRPDGGTFMSPPGTPASNLVVCPAGDYTTMERFDYGTHATERIFQVPPGQVWVFGLANAWMWMDQEVDLSADGTPESKWIDHEVVNSNYSGDYTAHVRDDGAGRACVNIIGNLAGPVETHHDGLGYDPFEISLTRLIKGVGPENMEITLTDEYARAIIKSRVSGDSSGYGLGEDPATVLSEDSGTISAVEYVSGKGYKCTVSWSTTPGILPFVARCDWRLQRGGTPHRMLDNTDTTITTTTNPGIGGFWIVRASNSTKFDPADSSSHTHWQPFDELDEMEIRINSPFASRLEKCVVDAGHDGRDNNGNNANSDGDTDGSSNAIPDYQELRWGYNPNDSSSKPSVGHPNAGIDEDGRSLTGSANGYDGIDDDGDGAVSDSDEVYALHEEWDMIRHHLTTRSPAFLSDPEKYQPNTPTPRASLNGAVANLDAALTAAFDGNATSGERVTALIQDWRDSDDEPDEYKDGANPAHYGVERHLAISELFWMDKTGNGPSNDDYWAVEIYNPFQKTLSLANYKLKYSAAGVHTFAGTTVDPGDRYVVVGSAMDDDFGGTIDGSCTTAEKAGLELDSGGSWVSVSLTRTVGGTDVTVDRAEAGRVAANEYADFANSGSGITPERGCGLERRIALADMWGGTVYTTGSSRLLVDDQLDEGISRVTKSGGWGADSAILNSYSGRCLSDEDKTGSASDVARFIPNLSESGYYWVYVYFPPDPAGVPDFATDAQVKVYYDGGGLNVTSAVVNQSSGGGKWVLLSAIDTDGSPVPSQLYFRGGTVNEYIEIAPKGDDDSGRFAVADAVAFVRHSLGAKNVTFDKGSLRQFDIAVKNRAFATLGELASLIDPSCISGTDLVYTDDAADGYLNIYKLSRDGTGMTDELQGVDNDGDMTKDEDDEGDIHLDMQSLVNATDNASWSRIFSYVTIHDVTKNDPRWHGRINMNTATRAMMMGLPAMGEFPDHGRRLCDALLRGRTPSDAKDRHGYRGIADIFAILNDAGGKDIPRASADGYDNDADADVDAPAGENTVTTSTATTVTVSGSPWTADEHINSIVYISNGPGCGQYRLITDNTTSTLTVSREWAVRPQTTVSKLKISPEYQGDVDYLSGDGLDNDMDGLTDEIGEGLEYFVTRIANLVTFRSDLFDVIVRGRVMRGGGEVASAQLRAVIDRSTSASAGRPKVTLKRWE